MRPTAPLLAALLGYPLVVPAAGAPPEPVALSRGGVSVSLPAGWKLQTPKPDEPPVLAARFDADGKKIADAMAITLSKTVEEESAELAASAERNPDAIKLVNRSELLTDSGLEGTSVVLRIAAKHPDFGAPLYFWSLYYPRGDGRSVTFKLRCGETSIKALIPEFKAIASSAKRQADRPIPKPGGVRVTGADQISGPWRKVSITDLDSDPALAAGHEMGFAFGPAGAVTSWVEREGEKQSRKGSLLFEDGTAYLQWDGDEGKTAFELWLDGDKLALRQADGRLQIELRKAED